VEWYKYEFRDKLNNLRILEEYPVEIINRKRIKKICKNEDEVFSHISEGHDKISPLILILSEKIDPRNFIKNEYVKLINCYSNVKKYGIQFFYHSSADIPQITLDFFNIIDDTINDIDRKKLQDRENINEQSRNNNQSKIRRK